jgi:hypothetical protein
MLVYLFHSTRSKPRNSTKTASSARKDSPARDGMPSKRANPFSEWKLQKLTILEYHLWAHSVRLRHLENYQDTGGRGWWHTLGLWLRSVWSLVSCVATICRRLNCYPLSGKNVNSVLLYCTDSFSPSQTLIRLQRSISSNYWKRIEVHQRIPESISPHPSKPYFNDQYVLKLTQVVLLFAPIPSLVGSLSSVQDTKSTPAGLIM